MKKIKFELPALTLKQNKKELYVFTVDGKDIYKFATISRITRSDSGDLSGYQRPEALGHINEIKEYLESKKGSKVAEGFRYNSGENTDWETVESLRSKIKNYLDPDFIF